MSQPTTIEVRFPTRNGYVTKTWELLRLTRTQIVSHNPDHVPGALTRFRRDDGRMIGDSMPHLTWRVSQASLEAIRAAELA